MGGIRISAALMKNGISVSFPGKTNTFRHSSSVFSRPLPLILTLNARRSGLPHCRPKPSYSIIQEGLSACPLYQLVSLNDIAPAETACPSARRLVASRGFNHGCEFAIAFLVHLYLVFPRHLHRSRQRMHGRTSLLFCRLWIPIFLVL